MRPKDHIWHIWPYLAYLGACPNTKIPKFRLLFFWDPPCDQLLLNGAGHELRRWRRVHDDDQARLPRLQRLRCTGLHPRHPGSALAVDLQLKVAQDTRESPDGAYSYVIDGPCPMSSLSNVSDLKHDNEEEECCSSEGPERDILMEFGTTCQAYAQEHTRMISLKKIPNWW